MAGELRSFAGKRAAWAKNPWVWRLAFRRV